MAACESLVDGLAAEEVGSAQLPARLLASPPTSDIAAYHLYLQGLSVRAGLGEHNLRRAIELFEQAIVLDPKFARVFAAKAFAHFLPVTFGYPVPHALESAEGAARQALALDASLAEAHAVLGNVDALRGRWLQAEKSFQTALTLDAEDDFVRRAYVLNVLVTAGHLRRALHEMREAYRLAPAEPLVAMGLAAVTSHLALDAEAERHANLAIDLGYPTVAPFAQVILAQCALRSGRYSDAARHFVGALPPHVRVAGYAQAIEKACAALVDEKQRADAVAALQSVQAASAGTLDPTGRRVIVQLYALLGDLDLGYGLANETLDYFGKSGNLGNAWGLIWTPEMRSFRNDPRFQAFAARLRLMDYWREQGPPDGCELRDGQLICS